MSGGAAGECEYSGLGQGATSLAGGNRREDSDHCAAAGRWLRGNEYTPRWNHWRGHYCGLIHLRWEHHRVKLGRRDNRKLHERKLFDWRLHWGHNGRSLVGRRRR
jgi:hypothetical protein